LKPVLQYKHIIANQAETRTLSATINERLQASLIIHVHHAHKSRINPPPSFYAVKATDDNVELHVVVLVLVLDLANKGRDFDTFDTLLDELCSGFSFRLADVSLTEEELAIQV